MVSALARFDLPADREQGGEKFRDADPRHHLCEQLVEAVNGHDLLPAFNQASRKALDIDRYQRSKEIEENGFVIMSVCHRRAGHCQSPGKVLRVERPN